MTATTTTETVDVEDLVGTAEIAYYAEVTKQAVSNWIARYTDGEFPFPQPVVTLDCGKIFSWDAVVTWLQDTGRFYE